MSFGGIKNSKLTFQGNVAFAFLSALEVQTLNRSEYGIYDISLQGC